MRVLLDTHVLLWWLLDDPRLSARAREVIRRAENEVLVSAASGWEIATKQRLGKLGVAGFDPAVLPAILREGRIDVLPIALEHALEAGLLRGPHRDPFDRMLIGQSLREGLPVVTQDPVFRKYRVRVIW
ncbi:MAG: type II toxin-antitoxin system VapC family toxin [Gemmatimonadetes bacterium]|nr:type II toxin-antitoxin system VapC family toxin [Gemmatimonadota bacterium]